MNKRFVFTALAGMIALSVLAVLVARTTTPVSARQILDRAYQAQSTQAEGEGISTCVSRPTETSVPAWRAQL